MRFNTPSYYLIRLGGRFKHRFRRSAPLFSTSLAAFVAMSGCGKFGSNPEPSTTLEMQSSSSHCMESMSADIQRYLKSEITQEAWSQKFDCILNSLDQFEKEVRPSDQTVEPSGSKTSGYTAQDVQAFFTRFVVKDERVSAELMNASFTLKSVLFGGRADRLNRQDLIHVRKFIRAVQKETTEVLPYLSSRNLDTANRIERVFINLSRQLYIPYKRVFHKQDMYVILRELFRLKNIHMHPDDLVLVGKVKELLIGGSPDIVEPDAWYRVFNLFGIFAGLYHSVEQVDWNKDIFRDAEYRNYLVQIVTKVMGFVDQSIQWHGGSISLDKVDGLIQALPLPSLDQYHRRSAISYFIRPIFSKYFRGKVMGELNQDVTKTFMELLTRWNDQQNLIQKVYDENDLSRSGVSREKLLKTIAKVSKELSVSQLTRAQSLAWLVHNFKPLHLDGGIEINISTSNLYSYHSLSIMSIVRILIEQFMQTYGNPRYQWRLKMEDFDSFFKDVLPFGIAFQVFDPESPDIAQRHFGYMNLFTWASNGDELLDVDEITYYLPMVLSAKALSLRIRNATESTCGGSRKDALGWQWMNPACFRKAFLDNRAQLLDHFPETLRVYEGLDQNSKLVFWKSVEKIARKYGYSEEPLASSDVDSIAMIFHYVESIFNRFDLNRDQKLDINEVLSAYPLFKQKLVSFSGLDPSEDDTLRAALTYTVYYGVPPNGDGFWDSLHFLKWKNFESWDDLVATRYTVYQLLAAIVQPLPIPSHR